MGTGSAIRLSGRPAETLSRRMPDYAPVTDSGGAIVGETEDAMLSVVFTWAAAVVGLLVLALMALSGVMIDSHR